MNFRADEVGGTEPLPIGLLLFLHHRGKGVESSNPPPDWAPKSHGIHKLEEARLPRFNRTEQPKRRKTLANLVQTSEQHPPQVTQVMQTALDDKNIHATRFEAQVRAIGHNPFHISGGLGQERWGEANAGQIRKTDITQNPECITTPAKEIHNLQRPVQPLAPHTQESFPELPLLLGGRLKTFISGLPARIAAMNASVPVNDVWFPFHFLLNSRTLPKNTTKKNCTPRTQSVTPGTTNRMV